LRLSFGVANGLVHRSFWTLFHPFFYRLFWYLSCTRKTQTTGTTQNSVIVTRIPHMTTHYPDFFSIFYILCQKENTNDNIFL
jgi:hypothetical protein